MNCGYGTRKKMISNQMKLKKNKHSVKNKIIFGTQIWKEYKRILLSETWLDRITLINIIMK